MKIDRKNSSCCCSCCSDGTLNPNGIRFGSAEIYSVVDQFNGEVMDSLCVAQRNPKTGDERVVLFLKVSFSCFIMFDHQSMQERTRRSRRRRISDHQRNKEYIFFLWLVVLIQKKRRRRSRRRKLYFFSCMIIHQSIDSFSSSSVGISW